MQVDSSKIEAVLARYGIIPATSASAAWSQALRLQQWMLLKSMVRKFGGFIRGASAKNDQKQILRAYDAQWKKKLFERYTPKTEIQGAPWVWGRRKWLMSNEAGAAIRLLYLDQVIERLRPNTVLEVGCGNGINLIMLSARYPHIRFTGLEPTEGGVSAARSVIDDGHLPEALVRFAPFEIHDLEAPSRLQVEQGDARSLPFADGSFDMVITSLALEQMEEIRPQALSEIVRVSGKWVAMLEPFREVNIRGWRRRYVITHDYFEGRIADLSACGLKVKDDIRDMPHKAMLGTALVVAQRSA
jgi:SAM-dependent methyltransferase